ncbi:hypothetical protein HRE53_20905 [Acaryochloris sp. 'Moss Beach']|uniref:hypothetical protein n=1 Tax=Acaryochloris sp. 'Moss Beach' TaxID=2740837 RepID=UPI001F191A0A|nr:hypothetical protein [Acaryochloris sp. 'Moss Beach']UJB68876.1 hypothetical protein HRE53_20905 [Acaryochloris sp. 'Moss Beach']
MTQYQSTPTKVLLSAGLFSVCLMTASTQKALSKTTEPIQPLLTTIAPTTLEHQNLSAVNFEQNRLAPNTLQDAKAVNKIEGQGKVAFFRFWRRRFLRRRRGWW